MKRLIGCLVMTLLLAACGEKASYSIDNPGTSALELEIDGITYQVPAGSSQEITLEAGLHSLRSAQLGELQFIVYRGFKGGLINPTLSDYVIAREVYIVDESKLKNFGNMTSTIEIDGVPFEGQFELRNDLFIDKAWRFAVNEPFPEVVTGHVTEHGGNFFSKIFRRDEFIAYFEQSHEAPGYFQQNRPHDLAPQVRKPRPVASTLPTISEPAYEKHTGPLREVYADYLKATTSDEQERLQKAYFDAQMAYTSATATVAYQSSLEARLEADQFVTTISRQFGSSAVILP